MRCSAPVFSRRSNLQVEFEIASLALAMTARKVVEKNQPPGLSHKLPTCWMRAESLCFMLTGTCLR